MAALVPGAAIGPELGAVVNLASRLVDAAAPGTVVVDEAYRRLLEQQDADFSFEELEPRELEGIGAVELWELQQPAALPRRP